MKHDKFFTWLYVPNPFGNFLFGSYHASNIWPSQDPSPLEFPATFLGMDIHTFWKYHTNRRKEKQSNAFTLLLPIGPRLGRTK